MSDFTRQLLMVCLLLSTSITPAQAWLAAQHSQEGSAEMASRLTRLTRQTDQTLHRVMKMAYLGYLGLADAELLEDQTFFHSAETLFTDLNRTLHSEVGPLLRDGMRLSETYWQRFGERRYLDEFTLRNLRVEGLMFSNSEDYLKARRTLLQALELARKKGDKKSLAYVLNNLSYSNFHLQRRQEAIENLREAVQMIREEEDPDLSSLFLYNLGWLYLNEAKWDEALSLFREVVQIGSAGRMPIRQVAALINLGSIHLYRGELEQAAGAFEKSLNLCRRINSSRYRAMSAVDLAMVRILQGESESAFHLLEEVLDLLHRDGRKIFLQAERVFLRQKVQRLAAGMEERGWENPGLSLLAGMKTGSPGPPPLLHSHFAHLLAVPAGAPAESASEVEFAQGSEEAVRLTVKSTSAALKSTFSTPVYLSIPADLKLRSIRFEVAYPEGSLRFVETEKGFLLKRGSFTLESEVSTRTNREEESRKEVVTLTVKVDDEAPEEAALPQGLFLYLSFQVPEESRHNIVNIENKIISAQTSAENAVPASRLTAENQTFTILGEDVVPIIVCFFYVH